MSVMQHQGASFPDDRISFLPQKIASFMGHPDSTFLLHIYCTPLTILSISPHCFMLGIDLCKLYTYGLLAIIVQKSIFQQHQ